MDLGPTGIEQQNAAGTGAEDHGIVTDFVAFPDDPTRRLSIPLSMVTDRFRGFHDDERMIAWGYWDTGALMHVQDTIRGKTIYPVKETAPRIGRYDDLLVYFIQAQTGQIKIGIAANPELRLCSLQTGSPVTLTLLATCPGGRPLEAEYHRRFAASRLHGEWFLPTPDVCAVIEAVKCR